MALCKYNGSRTFICVIFAKCALPHFHLFYSTSSIQFLQTQIYRFKASHKLLLYWGTKWDTISLKAWHPTLIKASFRISGSIQSPLRSHTRSFHTVSGSIRTLCAQPAQALNPFRLYPAVLHAPDAFPPPDPVHRRYCSMTSERNNAGSIL